MNRRAWIVGAGDFAPAARLWNAPVAEVTPRALHLQFDGTLQQKAVANSRELLTSLHDVALYAE